MPRTKKQNANESTTPIKIRPALTPEARENQLISIAYDLVEKRLLEGTASSQETTHFLKLGSTKERKEKEKLQEEITLLKAKTENLKSVKRTEELMEEAIRAMRMYSGQGGGREEDEEY